MLRSACIGFLCLTGALVLASNPNDQSTSVHARLKQEWSLHPGPLMLDAQNWLPSQVVLDGDRVIREPDLNLIAQTSARRHVRIGRADVFARRLKVGPGLASGRVGSLWRFVSNRKDALLKGMPLNELSGDEKEVLMESTTMFPAFVHALNQNSSALLELQVHFDWQENGREYSLFEVGSPSSKFVEAPSGIPPWAQELRQPARVVEALDFGEGKLISIRLLMAKVAELGYSVRYDARLEESQVFLKGQFEIAEFLESLREVLQTIPFFAQDQSANRSVDVARFRDVLIQVLRDNGFPQVLLDRLDDNYSISGSKSEFLEVPMFRKKFSGGWGDSSDDITVHCDLAMFCDEGVAWRTVSQDGMITTHSQMTYIISPP